MSADEYLTCSYKDPTCLPKNSRLHQDQHRDSVDAWTLKDAKWRKVKLFCGEEEITRAEVAHRASFTRRSLNITNFVKTDIHTVFSSKDLKDPRCFPKTTARCCRHNFCLKMMLVSHFSSTGAGCPWQPPVRSWKCCTIMRSCVFMGFKTFLINQTIYILRVRILIWINGIFITPRKIHTWLCQCGIYNKLSTPF